MKALKFKKPLAIFLALVMIFGLLPLSVFAGGTDPEIGVLPDCDGVNLGKDVSNDCDAYLNTVPAGTEKVVLKATSGRIQGYCNYSGDVGNSEFFNASLELSLSSDYRIDQSTNILNALGSAVSAKLDTSKPLYAVQVFNPDYSSRYTVIIQVGATQQQKAEAKVQSLSVKNAAGTANASPIEAGTDYQVQVSVKNTGTYKISPSVSLLEVRQTEKGIGSQTLADLEIGATKTASISWRPTEKGECSLKAVVGAEIEGVQTQLDSFSASVYVVTPSTLVFDVTPSDATVFLKDSSGNRIWPNESGIYSVLTGSEYSYTVSKSGYAAKSGKVTGGTDTSVKLTLTPISNTLPEYTGDWTNFRGNSWNMGFTSAETPVSASEAYLKWAKKGGVNYTSSVTPPIILNGCLYAAGSKNVYKIDMNTGETLATSENLAGNLGFALNPITYGGGMLFVPIGDGQIQALNAGTLESLWVSEKVGGQTLCPITYHNGYIYSGTWNYEDRDGTYFCISATDEDTSQKNETKSCTWTLKHKGGFYWAGAYATDNYVIFGSDDGSAQGNYTETAILYSVNPTTGAIIDTITGIKGDIRSTVSAVVDGGKTTIYFTTKGGVFGQVEVATDGKLKKDTYKTFNLGGMSTGTPIVYGGVAFIGVCGTSQFSPTGHSYKIIDVSTMTLITSVDTIPGYVQTSALLSTAYLQSTGKLYVYLTYNYTPGGIYMLEYDVNTKTAVGSLLFDPTGTSYAQYCICSLVCDSNGTIYYKNDSGYLMAVSRNRAYLTSLSSDKGTFKKAFSPNTSQYELVVPAGTQSVTLSFEAIGNSTVQVNGAGASGGSAAVSLTNGSGSASISVTNGSDTRTYSVSVREIQSNAALSELLVSIVNYYSKENEDILGLSPDFAPDTYSYSADPYDKSFLNVWPSAADPNASVELTAVSNVEDFNEGEAIPVTATNKGHNRYAVYFADEKTTAVVNIKVTAEDGVTVKNYQLTLNKKKDFTSPVIEKVYVSKTKGVYVRAKDDNLLHNKAYSFDGGTTWQSSPSCSGLSGDSVSGHTICVRDASGNTTYYEPDVDLSKASDIAVTVGAYDYTAKAAGLAGASETGVIMNYTFNTAFGSSANEVIAKAFADKGVTAEGVESGYVSKINGLGAGEGYSGWCMAYNNDDYANLGLNKISIFDGDTIRFDYTCNFDKETDDIGNGWFGLPIITKFELAGQIVTLSKSGSYDESYNYVAKYYISGNQGKMVPISGSGTASSPFTIPVTVASGTDISSLTAKYETSLNEHYRIVSGLDQNQDYTNGLTFSLSSLGGKHVAYYKVVVTKGSEATNPQNDDIKVKFRLIGATKSTSDIDLSTGGYNGSEYITWIKTTKFTLSKNSTVYDLFTQALSMYGLASVGADSNYVRTISAPAVCGGYELSEFTNGRYSGWMYTVNGKHPAYGLKEWKLEDGDTVIWHYVNDYRHEVEDWFDDPDYPALGDGTYWNKWLKADDKDPVSSSSSGTQTRTESGTTVTPSGKASNGKAALAVSQSDIAAAVSSARTNGSGEIVIAPKIEGSAREVSVELPKTSLSSVASDTNASLRVETPAGTISLPNAALDSIASQAAGGTVTVSLGTVEATKLTSEQQKAVGTSTVYDISVLSGSSKITEFGGSELTISLPYTLKEGESASGVTVWYMDASGTLQQMTATYDKDTGLATFTTTHLSYYLVGYAAAYVNPFTDVKDSDWFFGAVKYVSQKSVMGGTSATSFDPDANMTRAMVVTVLYRLEGKPETLGNGSFTDVEAGQWYTDAVKWASAYGIVGGYGGGLFGTNDSVTREQLASILYNYAKYKGYSVTGTSELSGYTDASAISAWAVYAMKWANAEGLIGGTTATTLESSGTATRAQVATILMRFMEKFAK